MHSVIVIDCDWYLSNKVVMKYIDANDRTYTNTRAHVHARTHDVHNNYYWLIE